MTRIIDLSDEPKYTIRKVASQTGIRPVTLRAWERRHQVLTPHRSDNRYRLYSERDVAILRWLKNRVDSGVSISNAASELRTMISQDAWPEETPAAPEQPTRPNTLPAEQYAVHLAQALIQHDEASAAELLREAQAAFDLMTLCTTIFVPALVEIGDAWYHGRIRAITEHFASAFLRGRLLTLLQTYPPRRNAACILLGGAPTEQHELGALMLSVLLRSQGYRVEFLGPDTPLDDLVEYASYEHPAMIVLSATTTPAALELKHLQERLHQLDPAPIFAYGGHAFDASPQLREQVPGYYLGNTLDVALQNTKTLLERSGRGLP